MKGRAFVSWKLAALLAIGIAAFAIGRYRATAAGRGQEIGALTRRLHDRTPTDGAATKWQALRAGKIRPEDLSNEDLAAALGHACRFGIGTQADRTAANDLLLELSRRDPVLAARWIFGTPDALGCDAELLKDILAKASAKDHLAIYEMLRSSRNESLNVLAMKPWFKSVPPAEIAGLLEGLPSSVRWEALFSTDALASLAGQDFDAAVRLIQRSEMGKDFYADAMVPMLARLADQDPDRAWEALGKLSCRNAGTLDEFFQHVFRSDLTADQAREIMSRIGVLPDGWSLEAGVRAAAKFCAEQDPASAAAMADQLPEGSRQAFLSAMLQDSVKRPDFDLAAGLAQLPGRADQMELLRIAADGMKDQPVGTMWDLSTSIADPKVKEGAIRESIGLDAWRQPEQTLDRIVGADSGDAQARLDVWMNSLAQHNGPEAIATATGRFNAWAATADPEHVPAVKAAIQKRVGEAGFGGLMK